MSTFVPSGKDIDRKWYVVDASGQTLGRLATKAAERLEPESLPTVSSPPPLGPYACICVDSAS